MTTQTETPPGGRRARTARISPFTVWYAVLGGVAAWALHLFVAWSTMEITCLGAPVGDRLQKGGTPGGTAMTVAYAGTAVPWLVALGALLTCLGLHRKLRRTPTDALASERTRLLVVIGIFLDVMMLAIITAGGIALAVLEPCG